MKAKVNCDAALDRAKHFLRLYELLHDTRKRGVRSEWRKSFNPIMHWPTNEQIVRVDGKNHRSVLILRKSVGITRTHFAHEYVSELLRAAIVAAVSALDRYFHDVLVEHSWTLLSQKDSKVPKQLQRLSVPILDTKRALTLLRKNNGSRPGGLIKKALQEVLHKEYTFQSPDDISHAAQMLGIADFWTKVASAMPGPPKKEQVINDLRSLSRRRNQIVHEADLVRKTRSQKITLRDIKEKEAKDWVHFVDVFVTATQSVVTAEI
jgi:restriction system protein